MIIGITGTDGAGKGAVVDYLVETKGFTHCPARRIILEELARLGLEPKRSNMRIAANGLRKQYGAGFMVDAYLERLDGGAGVRAVIESIRSLGEVEALHANGSILLAVDADQRLRYERIQARASESDSVTFEEFVEQEELEMNDPDPHGMQKAAVIAAADYTIENNGTLEELHEKIEEVLARIEAQKESA